MRKHLQKRLYTLLSTRLGVTVAAIGCLWLLYAAIQLLYLLLIPGSPRPAQCQFSCHNDFLDNLGGQSYEQKLCLPTVDVVYTWVNGSDHRLLRDIERYRREELASLQPEEIQADSEDDPIDSSSNRYRDNEELRYSLRSLWRFAPWIRHIYIVTNGQVPAWLRLDHPRLSIVTHKDIFPDSSHLPTFSSPAIEAHLHRIPGLADKFLYFNDDVMLGNSIWPDDFFSPLHGQNVFLTWDVPPCAPGCAETWIGDSYCDVACNTSECNFDGGDCVGAAPTQQAYGQHQRNQEPSSSISNSLDSRYCAYGCPNNWVGDKVCDRSCNVQTCGFDGGDCGLDDLQAQLHSIELKETTTLYTLPPSTVAFFINLTSTFSGRMLEASHDNPGWVRTSVITQKFHVLVMLLYGTTETTTPQDANVEVFLKGEHHEGERNFTFNITMPLPPKPTQQEQEVTQTEPPSVAVEEEEAAPLPSSALPPVELPQDFIELAPAAPAQRQLLSLQENERTEETAAQRLLRELGGSLDVPAVHVDGVPHFPVPPVAAPSPSRGVVRGTDDEAEVVPRAEWDEESEELSQWIEEAKQKQLQQLHEQDVAHAFGKLLQERTAESEANNEGPVWPWELADEVAAELAAVAVEGPVLKGHGPLVDGARPPGRRLLMDVFGNSLRYVNALYNDHFGREQRKVPAHMPHFIDKHVMEELQSTWPERFVQTSSHRFRHPQDMQYSFSYYYFYMNTQNAFNLQQTFHEQLDLNKDGFLSPCEVHALARLLGRRATSAAVKKLRTTLRNCTAQMWGYKLSEPPKDWREDNLPITMRTLLHCPSVLHDLENVVSSQRKYKTNLKDLNDVEFYMVRGNASEVGRVLDNILAKGPKFICLNDDMNRTHPDPAMLNVLHSFFETYYADPSPFELAPQHYHRAAYLHELDTARAGVDPKTSSTGMWLALAALLTVAALALFFSGVLHAHPSCADQCQNLV